MNLTPWLRMMHRKIEPDLGRKDLVLVHEGKCSEERSGAEPVSKEEWQGDKQLGGTAAEPCLEQNKDNIPRNRSQNLAEKEQKRLQNRSKNMFQNRIRNRFQKQVLELFSWKKGKIGSLHFISLRGTRFDILHCGWRQDQSLTPSSGSRTSWVKFRTVPRNKARLAVQRYNQGETQQLRYGSLG